MSIIAEKPGGQPGALQLDSSGALRITAAGGGGATEAKQDDQIVQLDAIIAALGAGGVLAQEATQQDVLTVLGTLGTETTLEAILTALGASGVLAKETTLADVRTAVQAIASSTSTLVSQTDSLETDLAAVKAQTDTLEASASSLVTQTDELEPDIDATRIATEATRDRLPSALGPQAASGSLSTVGAASSARAVHLASQTLPAAGAYTSQALYTLPTGIRRVAFWVTYTRGAVNGRASFHLQWGNGTETSGDIVLDAGGGAVSNEFLRTDFGIGELRGPQPPSASAINFVIAAEAPPGATAVRLLVAESGATGTPGTIAVAVTGST